MAANVGYLESTEGGWGEWYKTGAPFECAAEGGYGPPYYATYVPAVLPSANNGPGLWFEYWVTNQRPTVGDSEVELHTTWQTEAGPNHYVTLSVNFTKGTLTARSGANADPTKNNTVGWTWTPLKTEGKRMHIGWWVRFWTRDQMTVTPVVTVDDGVPAFLNEGSLPTPSMRLACTLEKVRFGLTNLLAEAFQVSTQLFRPGTAAEVTQRGTWKRGARLDAPQFPLRMLPAVRGSAWDVITEIARATMATAEFTADGYFLWRDHRRWSAPPSVADLEVTSARELAGLTITEEIDACRNYCTVRVSDWSNVVGAGEELLKDAVSTPIEIAPQGTLVRTLPIEEKKNDPRTPRGLMPTGELPPSHAVIRSGSAADSQLTPSSVEISMRRDPGAITLGFRNLSASPVYYHGAQLSTIAPSEDPGSYVWSAWNDESRRLYGTQVYEHDVKGWVQDLGSAMELAVALRNAAAFPIPLMQSVEILPDPRIELGDVVRVKDTTGAQLDTLAWVIGIKTSGSSGRVTQTLTLRGTAFNGVPQDSGLTPDLPADPAVPPP
ncbi:hypothetical protein ACGFRG_25525 [Streptomyces sp. NPDC048696]|uniref:hypothetical protein n=1 Tax=Streptomyces sp. NPDC048696 TaxID=3365585 RepID=UPI0037194B52